MVYELVRRSAKHGALARSAISQFPYTQDRSSKRIETALHKGDHDATRMRFSFFGDFAAPEFALHPNMLCQKLGPENARSDRQMLVPMTLHPGEVDSDLTSIFFLSALALSCRGVDSEAISWFKHILPSTIERGLKRWDFVQRPANQPLPSPYSSQFPREILALARAVLGVGGTQTWVLSQPYARQASASCDVTPHICALVFAAVPERPCLCPGAGGTPCSIWMKPSR